MNNNNQITLNQLARLYQARNEANKRMSQALRSKDKAAIAAAKAEATNLNKAYNDAHKVYKRQQKKHQREQWRTKLIRFYLDAQEQYQAEVA